MSSHRHNPEPRDAYLDAARECILDVGWRRTTLTEVARRAGVSRMTIYRTWSDMPQLLGDLMTREWQQMLAEVPTYDGSDAPGAAQIGEGILRVVEALRGNELFTRILDLDPELLLPYLLERRGRSQELVLGLLSENIAAAQRGGTVRDGDPVTLARSVLLAAHGFVLSIDTMTDERVDRAALDNELVALVTGYLAPTGGPR